MSDDAELLRHYASEESEDAFGKFVQRHIGLVYSVALRQAGGDRHLAQDVTQLVFTAAARKAAALARRPVIDGWLYRTTQFTAIDAVRAAQRRRAREQQAHAMQELSADAATPPLEWEKLRTFLDRAIGELGDTDRDAIALRFFHGCSFADVGAKLRLTENAARMRVERALDKLHAALARRGVTSTAGAIAVVLGEQAVSAAPAGLAATITSASLAAAASGTGALAAGVALLSLVSTNKVIFGAAGLALALAVTGTWQQRANARLAQEISALQRENRAAAAVREHGADGGVPMDAGATELVRLGQRTTELRATLAALESTAPAPPPMKTQDAWRNLGYGTPVEAFETMLWASFSGDHDVLANVFVFTLQGRARMETFFATLPPAVRAKFGSPERLLAPLYPQLPPIVYWVVQERDAAWKGRLAFRVVAQKQIDPNRVELQLLVNILPLRPEGNWQVELVRGPTGWVFGPWDVSVVERLIAQIDPATGAVRPNAKVLDSSRP